MGEVISQQAAAKNISDADLGALTDYDVFEDLTPVLKQFGSYVTILHGESSHVADAAEQMVRFLLPSANPRWQFHQFEKIQSERSILAGQPSKSTPFAPHIYLVF
jgi:hypothetical protein